MTAPLPTSPFYSDSGTIGVLLLHGFTGSPASLRPLAEQLAAAGYRVSLPVLPGHGTTWQQLAVTSWQDWSDYAERELLALRRSCDRVFVVGLSMGGALALRLAARRSDDVAGLVLVNPALTAKNPLLGLAGVLKHVVKTTPGVGNDIAQPGQNEHAYDLTPTASAHELSKLWADLRPYLDLVICPMLIFRSAIDHVVPKSSLEIIRRQTSSMDVTEVVLANSYHVATLDFDAPLIEQRTLAFVAEHSSGEPQSTQPSQPSPKSCD